MDMTKSNLEARWFRLERRAATKKIPFNLTLEHLRELYNIEKCPCCDAMFSTGKKSENASNCRSIDRLVPSLGYTDFNTGVICRECNNQKGTSTLTELYELGHFRMANWLAKTIKDRENSILESDARAIHRLDLSAVKIEKEAEPPIFTKLISKPVFENTEPFVPCKVISTPPPHKEMWADRIGESLCMVGMVIKKRREYVRKIKHDVKEFMN